MTLSAIFGAGLSGLQAAQTGMRTVSQNVANVNTVGYARSQVDFTSSMNGVSVSSIRRAADQFLAAAALNASAQQGGASALSDLLDRAQASFGDPTSDTSLFSTLGTVFNRFGELASDPSNTLRKANAIQSTQSLLTQLRATGQQLESLRLEADQRLAETTKIASDLMQSIATMNKQIALTRANGGDATGAENAQSQLLDQLSGYIDIHVTQRDAGGVEVRTVAGALLISDVAVTLSHTAASTAYGAATGISYVDRNGASHPLEGLVRDGAIAALVKARDVDLPALADGLGQLAASTADALNAAHNQASAVPAATSLTGRQTGLLSTDLLGFTGKTTLAVTGPTGTLLHKIAIDFTARTYSVDGGAAVSWPTTETVGQFASAINSALGSDGAMNFTGGVLSVSGAGGNGVFFQDDATTPSSRGGRGFSHFFGLNDLVTRSTPTFFETGFTSTDAHGLTAGGAIGFRVLDADGREVLNRNITVTGTTWGDMMTAMNAPSTGLGSYGSFSMDSSGRMNATMANGYRIEFIGDTTARGGLSMSNLFGLGRAATAGRAVELQINSAITADPTRLAVAKPDLTAALGAMVMESGDGRGALALAGAADKTRAIPAAGALASQSTTLTAYASLLGGDAGRRAADADNAHSSAEAVLQAAAARRSSVEGVQLDDELVKMTQFQQSYAAASRLIQAARDMFDILLAIK